MRTKFSIITGILICTLLLSSCRSDLPQDLYMRISEVSSEDGTRFVQYQDEIYYHDAKKLFAPTEDGDAYKSDVFLGWTGLSVGWFYINRYYSDTQEKPLFIYEARLDWVYLRNDYDYKTDVFVLEGTESKFIFSDALKDTNFEYDIRMIYENEKDIVIHSERYPRLKMPLTVFSSSGNWYVGGRNDDAILQISEEFVKILTQTN